MDSSCPQMYDTFLSISRVHSKRAAHRKAKDPGIDRAAAADKKPVSAAQLITFRVSRRPRGMYCGHARLCVCLCVCLSVCVSVRGRMSTLLHGPGCNLGSGRKCPLVMHHWANLQSVDATLWKCVAQSSGNPPSPPHACRTRTLRMPAKTPLAGDKIDAPAACAVPFRPYCGGVVTRTRNVSEYMLVLALSLVQ